MVNRMHLGGDSQLRGRTLMLSALVALVLAVMASAAYSGQALAYHGEGPPPDEGATQGSVGGSLESLVQQQVGDFQLLEVWDQPARDPISGTVAIEATSLYYESPEGVQIRHALELFGSPEEATAKMEEYTRTILAPPYSPTDPGYQVQETFPVTSVDGEQLGEAVVVGNGDTEVVFWTNGTIFASIVSSPAGEGLPFYDGLAY